MRKKDTKIASKVIAIVILLAFVGSMFAVTQFGDKPEGTAAIEISGYTFYNYDGEYVTEVKIDSKPYALSFYSNPQNLTSIKLDKGVITELSKRPNIYITHNPNKLSKDYATYSYIEIGKVLEGIYGKVPTWAFTEDQVPPDMSIPIYTCSDASASTGIIELRLGDETKIDVEGSCVVVQGEDEFAMLEASSKLAMWLAGLEI